MRWASAEIGMIGDRLASGHIQHRDGTGAHIRRVPAPPVASDHEHVRFLLPGGDGAHNLEGLRVDDGHRLIEFRGHIDQIVDPIVDRAMGAHAVAKIDLAGDLLAGNIDHHHLPAVGSRLAYTRVSVDRHIGGSAIGRGGDFVAGDAPFRHCGELLVSGRVDDAEVAVSLVGGHQERFCRVRE